MKQFKILSLILISYFLAYGAYGDQGHKRLSPERRAIMAARDKACNMEWSKIDGSTEFVNFTHQNQKVALVVFKSPTGFRRKNGDTIEDIITMDYSGEFWVGAVTDADNKVKLGLYQQHNHVNTLIVEGLYRDVITFKDKNKVYVVSAKEIDDDRWTIISRVDINNRTKTDIAMVDGTYVDKVGLQAKRQGLPGRAETAYYISGHYMWAYVFREDETLEPLTCGGGL